MYATIVLSWYRPDTREGHLYKIQTLYRYFKRYTSTYINYNTETPDYNNFKNIEGNWGNLYAGEPEDLFH